MCRCSSKSVQNGFLEVCHHKSSDCRVTHCQIVLMYLCKELKAGKPDRYISEQGNVKIIFELLHTSLCSSALESPDGLCEKEMN